MLQFDSENGILRCQLGVILHRTLRKPPVYNDDT